MSTHELHEIRAIADHALAASSDQLLVSQRQYVDVLLDLRSMAVSPVMWSTIDDRLREIRFVTMIHASKIRADLNAVVAVSEIEDELEMSLAVGSFFGGETVRALHDGIDQVTYPLRDIAVIVAIICLFGAAAAIVPARRARLDVLTALTAE